MEDEETTDREITATVLSNSKYVDGYWGDCLPGPAWNQPTDKPHPDISLFTVTSVNRQRAGVSAPTRTSKWWGYELTFYNEEYCSKWLHFDNLGHTSMHFHVDKHETLLVISGMLTLEVLFNKELKVHRLGPGTAWVMPPGLPHRLIAAEGPVDVIESSTLDTPEDSIRID